MRPNDSARRTAACAASGARVTVFHTFAWSRRAAALTRTRFVPLVLTGGGRDLGAVPLLLRSRGPFVLVNWVPFPYAGPLVPDSALADCLRLIDRRLRRRIVVRHQQSFAPGAVVPRDALTAAGFEISEDETFVVDLQTTVDRVWERLDPGCRRPIRKARRDGVEVDDAEGGAALTTVVDAMFAARGLRSEYRGELAVPDADVEVEVHPVVARSGVEVVGAMTSLTHRGSAAVWQGGALPERRSTNAAPLLYWDAVVWAYEVGARSIDLVGLPDDGIRHFKSQFGGTLTTYVVGQRSFRRRSRRATDAPRARVGARPVRPPRELVAERRPYEVGRRG